MTATSTKQRVNLNDLCSLNAFHIIWAPAVYYAVHCATEDHEALFNKKS